MKLIPFVFFLHFGLLTFKSNNMLVYQDLTNLSVEIGKNKKYIYMILFNFLLMGFK